MTGGCSPEGEGGPASRRVRRVPGCIVSAKKTSPPISLSPAVGHPADGGAGRKRGIFDRRERGKIVGAGREVGPPLPYCRAPTEVDAPRLVKYLRLKSQVSRLRFWVVAGALARRAICLQGYGSRPWRDMPCSYNCASGGTGPRAGSRTPKPAKPGVWHSTKTRAGAAGYCGS